jgi:hypothetical protein
MSLTTPISDAADTGWCPCPAALEGEPAFCAEIQDLHRQIDTVYFATDPAVNRRLAVQVRAYREIESWRVALVLTPWMLARVLVPTGDPGVEVPPEWRMSQRRNAPYQVLGPRVQVTVLGQAQHAHVNFHPRIGHYLLQPIALDMTSYDDAEAVFRAWGEVIRTRDENMARQRKECRWQKEISRREWFARLRGSSA